MLHGCQLAVIQSATLQAAAETDTCSLFSQPATWSSQWRGQYPIPQLPM